MVKQKNKEAPLHQQQQKDQSRTVNVSADGGPSKRMTPEAAARYLQQATTNTSNREVKISFGPSPAEPSMELLRMQNFLRENLAKEGLGTTEAEMKNLMGMFVDMLAQTPMDMSKGGKTADAEGLANMFGAIGPNADGNWPDQEALAAAAASLLADGASLDAIRRTYAAAYQSSDSDDYMDGDEDENESIPDLDDFSSMDPKQAIMLRDLASIGKAAMTGTLEAQDHARKAAKNREKKKRRKQKQREEAAAKAAEEAQRQREEEIMLWRNRVVTACQSTDIALLESLIDTSPFLDDDEDDNDILPHLEFLIPYSLPKSRAQVQHGKDFRCRLASYILDEELHMAFEPMQNGRSILQAAAFYGDIALVSMVLDKLEQYFQAHARDKHPFLAREDLDLTCLDAGWTALHYAASSGSADMLEILLRTGCSVKATSDPTHTRQTKNERGITAYELIECLKFGTYKDTLYSDGNAFLEIQSVFLKDESSRRAYTKTLENALKRIKDVEINGYIVPGLLDLSTSTTKDNTAVSDSLGVKKRKKKKKKKKQGAKDSNSANNKTQDAVTKVPMPSSAKKMIPQEFEDPLVTALAGMGFAKDQIAAAVKACGGTSRATADELVTWILGQDMGTVSPVDESNDSHSSAKKDTDAKADEGTQNYTEEVELNQTSFEEKRRQEDAAKRLAEKREEQRRRNREWNNKEQARQEQARVNKVKTVATTNRPPIGVTGPYALQTVSQTAVGKSQSIQHPHNTSIATQLGSTPNDFTRSSDPVNTNFPTLSQTVSASQQPQSAQKNRSYILNASTTKAQQSFGDDDRTVSSIGSNRALSGSSTPFLPPGLIPPASTHKHAVSSVTNPPGFQTVDHVSKEKEFRATAQEFVPLSRATDHKGVSQTILQERSTHPMNTMGVNASPSYPPVAFSLSQDFLSGGVNSMGEPHLAGNERLISTPAALSSADRPVATRQQLSGIPGFETTPQSSELGGYGFGLSQFGQSSNKTSSLLSTVFTNNSSDVQGDALWNSANQVQSQPSLIGLPPLNFESSSGYDNRESDKSKSTWGSTSLPGSNPSGSHGGSIW